MKQKWFLHGTETSVFMTVLTKLLPLNSFSDDEAVEKIKHWQDNKDISPCFRNPPSV